MAPGGIEPPRADSKSAALSAELRGRGRSLDPGRGGVAGEREVHLEAAALAWVARDDELPARGSDDLARVIEAAGGPHAQVRGSAEERLEDARAEDGVDPDAGVADGEQRVVAGARLRCVVRDPGRERHGPALEHRVPRVEAEVEKEPLELGACDPDAGAVEPEREAQLDLIADERAQRRLVAQQLRVEVEAVDARRAPGHDPTRRGRHRRLQALAGEARRDQDAVEPAWAAVPVADDVDEVAHREHRPVGADHPVLEDVVAGAESDELVANASPVVRMDHLLAEARILEPAGERIVEELLRVPAG